MQLNKTEGVIENLSVTPCKQNILYAPHMEEAAGVSAIVFALAGMAGAAAQTAVNVDAGSDDVEVYRFTLNGHEYAGVTRKASFKNGDHVEVFYREKPEGFEVLGVRRPDPRSIWLYSYFNYFCSSILLFGVIMLAVLGFVGLLFSPRLYRFSNPLDDEFAQNQQAAP